MRAPGNTFDGYTLIRLIGRGGFGEVWLCRAAATRDFRALKFIPADSESALERELDSLIRYRNAAARIRSPHITLIEHVNRCESGLFYVMPLADGVGAASPESPDWHPQTLGTTIAAGRVKPAWYSSAEIITTFTPVLDGLQCLADAGLAHRDIKPENILFFGGKPCLGDIGLMTADHTQLTRHGTPGYSAPSWYREGHADMYAAAATLYSLLTGNPPDRMGRAAFNWPPQGEASLSPSEREQWRRLHGVIRRATEERPAERYPDFTAMARALAGETITTESAPIGRLQNSRRIFAIMAAGAGLIAGVWGFALRERETTKAPPPAMPVDKNASLMRRLAPLLEENERIGRTYEQKLNELLAFYQTNAPAVVSKLESLSGDTITAEDFGRRAEDIAPKLKALVRPEVLLRDDPRIPLPKDAMIKRIADAKQAGKAGIGDRLTTLADARAEARVSWETVFEQAAQCPQNPDEQFWFDKRVSERFYASPARATRPLPPMETLWFAKADNDPLMQPLAEGLLRQLLTKAALVARQRQKDGAWTAEATRQNLRRLDDLLKSALWVEIQIGSFMKPTGSNTAAMSLAFEADFIPAPASPAGKAEATASIAKTEMTTSRPTDNAPVASASVPASTQPRPGAAESSPSTTTGRTTTVTTTESTPTPVKKTMSGTETPASFATLDKRQAFRSDLLKNLRNMVSVIEQMPSLELGRTPMVSQTDAYWEIERKRRNAVRPMLVALYRKLSAEAAKSNTPCLWQEAPDANPAEQTAFDQWRDAVNRELKLIEGSGADDPRGLTGVPPEDERHAFRWVTSLIHYGDDIGPNAPKR